LEKLITESGKCISIAACNAKGNCVISGTCDDVDALLSQAAQLGIRVKRLKVSHGFHSHLMEPVMKDFLAVAKEVQYSRAKVRFVSSLYAREIEEEEVLDASYWTSHIREKVDFYHALQSLDSTGDCIYLEIGSNRVLSALCQLIFDGERVVLGTLSIKREDDQQIAATIASLYIANVKIDWHAVISYGKVQWNQVFVPTYPYEKERFWKNLSYDHGDSRTLMSNESHPLLGQKIESPLMDGVVVFQRSFTADEPYFMKEHIIFDSPISPAAAHISMVLSAVKEIWNPKSCVLKSVELRTPLVVNSWEKRWVQLCIGKLDGNKTKFQLVSRDVDLVNPDWVIHAQGEVEILDFYFDAMQKADIQAFKERKEDDVRPEDGVYTLMRNRGFDLGVGFRRIRKAYCTEGECVCFIQPDQNIPNLEIYELYPGVIDSILQSQLCARLDELNQKHQESGQRSDRTIIPYYLKSISYNFRRSDDLWVHGLSQIGEDVLYSTLKVYNEIGETIMKMDDIIANITDRDSLLREIRANSKGLYYHTVWREFTRDLVTSFQAEDELFVLCLDNVNTADHLRDQILERKKDVVVILHKDGGLIKEESEELFYVDMSQEQSVRSLVSKLLERNRKLKFLYCNGLDAGQDEDFKDIMYPLYGLLYLVQAVDKLGAVDKVLITTVTRNVHQVADNGKINLFQSPLWGMVKVLSIEYPEVYDGIIDTDLQSGRDRLLIDEIIGHSAEEVSLYGGKRYVSRMVRHTRYNEEQKGSCSPLSLQENASYLITGGTGALGMTYAQQLIEKGAKYIILMCRKEPPKDTLSQIEEWCNHGVKIYLAYADVCQEGEVEKAIQVLYRKKVPKIKGVIHAAGILKDRFISDQTLSDFDLVLAPKIYGTLNVHQALRQHDLDFFLLLSSISSIIGNVGQSSYAAANYFLNQFAAQLRQQNVDAYSVCWGPWGSGGMASGSAEIDRNIDAMGVQSFSVETGGQLISQFMNQPYTDTIIADFRWDKMRRNINKWQGIFLSEILGEQVQNEMESDEESELSISLNSLAQEERKEYLLTVLQERCGKIMGFTTDRLLSVDIALREQGADSLMIFTMRTTINKLLGTNIDVSTFFNYPTLIALTNYLIDEVIFAGSEENGAHEDSKLSDASTEEILAELEKLVH
jgi:NAD(P)-dependent dehydrogenase (short-subunit alcohol dehydrogenase family)